MTKNIIIDTDMGVDDILAINLLFNKPSINIKAFSTVKGVANLSTGTKNLARILTFSGKVKLPIYQGYCLPKQKINFPIIDRQRANNLTLLKNISLPSKSINKIYINQLIKNLPIPSTLLCLGPLTNLAALINKKPKITNNLKKIIIMGGAVFSPGNIPPSKRSEYNIALDPQAAQTVFSSGLPITLVAIDATRQVSAKNKLFIKQILTKKPQTNSGKIIQAIILNNKNDFINFYDPLASAILLDNRIVLKTVNVNITVKADGQTIGKINPKGKISLITKVNKKAFYQLIIRAVK